MLGNYSRIDYFLIGKELEVDKCDIRPAQIMFTDHMAVFLKIKCDSKCNRGPGVWKINNSILANEEYCTRLKTLMNKLEQSYEYKVLDKRQFWDFCKISIKQMTLDFSKNKSKNEIEKIEMELKL